MDGFIWIGNVFSTDLRDTYCRPFQQNKSLAFKLYYYNYFLEMMESSSLVVLIC